jgi:hypothetical protein
LLKSYRQDEVLAKRAKQKADETRRILERPEKLEKDTGPLSQPGQAYKISGEEHESLLKRFATETQSKNKVKQD